MCEIDDGGKFENASKIKTKPKRVDDPQVTKTTGIFIKSNFFKNTQLIETEKTVEIEANYNFKHEGTAIKGATVCIIADVLDNHSHILGEKSIELKNWSDKKVTSRNRLIYNHHNGTLNAGTIDIIGGKLQNDNEIKANQKITIDTNECYNISGIMSSARDISISAYNQFINQTKLEATEHILFKQVGVLKNEHVISSKVITGDIRNLNNKVIIGEVRNELIDLKVDLIENEGDISSGKRVRLEVKEKLHNRKRIYANQSLEANIGVLENEADILSDRNLSLGLGQNEHSNLKIIGAKGHLSVENKGILKNTSQLLGNQSLVITGTGSVNNEYEIKSEAGPININIGKEYKQSGSLSLTSSEQKTSIKAKDIINLGEIASKAKDIEIRAHNKIENKSYIRAHTEMILEAEKMLFNQGRIETNTNFKVEKTAELINEGIVNVGTKGILSAGRIRNETEGVIRANQEIYFTKAVNEVINDNRIHSAGIIKGFINHQLHNKANIEADQEINLTRVGEIKNEATIEAKEKLTIEANKLKNYKNATIGAPIARFKISDIQNEGKLASVGKQESSTLSIETKTGENKGVITSENQLEIAIVKDGKFINKKILGQINGRRVHVLGQGELVNEHYVYALGELN